MSGFCALTAQEASGLFTCCCLECLGYSISTLSTFVASGYHRAVDNSVNDGSKYSLIVAVVQSVVVFDCCCGCRVCCSLLLDTVVVVRSLLLLLVLLLFFFFFSQLVVPFVCHLADRLIVDEVAISIGRIDETFSWQLYIKNLAKCAYPRTSLSFPHCGDEASSIQRACLFACVCMRARVCVSVSVCVCAPVCARIRVHVYVSVGACLCGCLRFGLLRMPE